MSLEEMTNPQPPPCTCRSALDPRSNIIPWVEGVGPCVWIDGNYYSAIHTQLKVSLLRVEHLNAAQAIRRAATTLYPYERGAALGYIADLLDDWPDYCPY